GRVRVKDTGEVMHGSPLAAWFEALRIGYVDLREAGVCAKRLEVMHGSPLAAWFEALRTNTGFTQVHIADADSRLVAATVERLRRENAPVYSETGPAEVTVDRIIPKLNKSGLHFAFLDPYNLGALPFE